MDQRGYTSDEQDHRDRQRIGQQTNIYVEVASHHPVKEFYLDDTFATLAAFEAEHPGEDHE